MKFRKEPLKLEPLHFWKYPSEPGEIVHAKILEFNKTMFVIIIEQFSK